MKWKWKNLQKVGKLVCKVVLYWDSFESGPPLHGEVQSNCKDSAPVDFELFERERERHSKRIFPAKTGNLKLGTYHGHPVRDGEKCNLPVVVG